MSGVITVTNTIAFVFPNNATQPTLPEMVRFVKGLAGDKGKMDTLYKNAEEKTVFIKYKSEEAMREALSLNEKKQAFHYSNGTQVEVCMSVAGSNIQYIRVFDLPPEVTDGDLIKELSKYGKIKRCIREKIPSEYELDLFTSVRGIYMDVEEEIPSIIFFLNKRGRIFYSGNKLKCFACGEEGHQKNNCSKKKEQLNKATHGAVDSANRKEDGKNTFAAVLAGTSTSENGSNNVNEEVVDLEIEMLENREEEEGNGAAREGELDHEEQQVNRQNQQLQIKPVLHYQQQQQQKVGNWTEYVQMHTKLLKQQKKQQKYANDNSPPRKTQRANSGTGSD